jgi:regulator of sigma E protease
VVAFVLNNILAFLAVIGGLILLHELGHYLPARAFGIGIERFSLGFGPILCSVRDRSGTSWALSLIPLGGYVKFKNLGAKEDPVSSGIFYEEATRWQRAVIIAGGPLANVVVGFLLFLAVSLTVPTDMTPSEIGSVEPGSVAAEAGFRPGDFVLAVDDRRITRFADLSAYVRMRFDRPIAFTIQRDGEILVLHATPKRVDAETRVGRTVEYGRLGIGSVDPVYRSLGFVEAVELAATATAHGMMDMGVGLYQIVIGIRSLDNLSGPIGLAQMTGIVVEHGLVSLVLFAAVISLNLALVNMIPLPLLDGGQLVMLGVEVISRRRIPEAVQTVSTIIGLLMIISLFILTTANDLSFIV